MTRTRHALILSATLVATLALAACGGSGSTSIPGIGDIPDAGNLQEAGQQISAAAAECSAGSQKMSQELQVLTQAIRDKDLEAAQATAPVFEEAAEQMMSSVETGTAAAQELSSIPGGGDMAVKGTETAFKICKATSEFATDLATKVSQADSEDAFDELSTASDELSDKISQASDDLNSSLGG